MKRYWLLKTEPNSYSIDDLKKDKKTEWTGVRNYQARNTIHDLMSKGDEAFFYHSSTDEPAIVGTCTIDSEALPDPTAFDKKDSHFDPKSSPASPTWFCRIVKFQKKFDAPVSLTALRSIKGLDAMVLLQRGSRLSVQPVTEEEWKIVMREAGA